MADEIANNARSAAMDFENKFEWGSQIAAAVFGATLGHMIDKVLIIDKLRMQLAAAEQCNSELRKRLYGQSEEVNKEAEKLEEEYTKSGVPAVIKQNYEKAGLPVPSPREAAIEVANEHWLQKCGDTIGFIEVSNSDARIFEHDMAKKNIAFNILPVQRETGNTIYLVKGEDLEKIRDIGKNIENTSLVMTAEDARKLFSHQLVKNITGLSESQCRIVQEKLADKDIPSMVKDTGDGKCELIAKVQDIENNREFFDKAVGEALLIGNSRATRAYDRTLDQEREAFVEISAVGNDSSGRESGIIYDADHPENSLEFKKGGIIVRENEIITGIIDTHTEEGREDAVAEYNKYKYPILMEGSFEELKARDYGDLTRPAVARTYLESRLARQENIIEGRSREVGDVPDSHEKAEKDYQQKVSRNTDNATRIKGDTDQLKYNPGQTVEDFIQADQENDAIDNANEGKAAVIKDLENELNGDPKILAKELSAKVQEQADNIEEKDDIYRDEALEHEEQEAAAIEDHQKKREIDEELDDQDRDEVVRTMNISDMLNGSAEEQEEEEEEDLSADDFEDSPF